MKLIRLITYLAIIIIGTTSCVSKDSTDETFGTEVQMQDAQLLSMRENDEGVILAEIKNPWDTTAVMARYALVPRGKALSGQLPADAIVISVPVEKSIVYSGVHTSLIDELGALGRVNGVCDVEYIRDAGTLKALKERRLANCGQSMTPNLEKIMSIHPDIVILSPYENSDETSKFSSTGINVLLAADYMESTPLGRAEWMRFYGKLYGKGAESDSLFSSIKNEYETARKIAAKSKIRPTVLFDRPYAGIWDVPTSGSVTGHLIEDAGGINPFSKYKKGGSAQLAPEEVLYTAQHADIWLIRHTEYNLNLNSLSASDQKLSAFDAYKARKVYGANTLETPLFEEAAFHPQIILKELISIFNTGATSDSTTSNRLVYFKKL